MKMPGAKAVGEFSDIFLFPQGIYKEKNKSEDEVQKDKQSWKI